ncbi:hypothetical protein M2366_001147 [Aeromonas sp. BIGb0405]|nr:hypothetical protein [Aeromonas sp. BIGb0405]
MAHSETSIGEQHVLVMRPCEVWVKSRRIISLRAGRAEALWSAPLPP